MTRLIVDSATETKLLDAQRPLEICGQTGRVLGHFIPVLDAAQHPGMEPQISEEELQRREKLGGGRPLSAILADLEKRT